MRTTTMRSRVITGSALAVTGLLAAVGCTASGPAPDESAASIPTPGSQLGPASATAAFCVRFPQREAGALFDAPDDPAVAGDPQIGDELLELGAGGLAESAPPEIHDAVDTYVAALRGYTPGTDPRNDAAVSSAIAEIDLWLRDHCAPTPGTTPP